MTLGSEFLISDNSNFHRSSSYFSLSCVLDRFYTYIWHQPFNQPNSGAPQLCQSFRFGLTLANFSVLLHCLTHLNPNSFNISSSSIKFSPFNNLCKLDKLFLSIFFGILQFFHMLHEKIVFFSPNLCFRLYLLKLNRNETLIFFYKCEFSIFHWTLLLYFFIQIPV